MSDKIEWHLVLMLWGDKYPDKMANDLIDSAFHYSSHCAGAVVITDRIDRAIDPRARQVLIPEDFNTEAYKKGALPIKISMFDIPDLPDGAVCLYIDLDSVVVGSLDDVAALIKKGQLWTIDVFPRRFNARTRRRNLKTGGAYFRVGNASTFLFRNKYAGNPTEQFRQMRDAGTLPDNKIGDEVFIGWTQQQILRGFPIDLVSYFRIEFLAPTNWLSDLFALWRGPARRNIRIVTFPGQLTKMDRLFELEDGQMIEDHYGRKGRWSDRQMNGMKSRMLAEMKRLGNDG